MSLEFYRCSHCKQIVMMIKPTGVPVVCCGEDMKPIKVGSVDAAVEKHVPVIEQNGNLVTVQVGSVTHPMTEPHYIEWILLQTKNGIQKVDLLPTDMPQATFALVEGDEVVSAYAYCNLHGLWKA